MRAILLALALCTTLGGQNVVWSVNNPSPFASVDKRQHFIAGIAIGAWTTAMAHCAGLKRPWIYGALAATLVGFLKEVHDRRVGGKAEVADAVNTAIGGLSVSYVIRF